MRWIYLDNNATTQPDPAVVTAVCEMHEQLWANPSSVHRFGQEVRHRVELARSSVSSLIGCRDRELVFTSGGTEANHLALWGVLGRQGGAPKILITTKIEHAAIREPAEALAECGGRVVYLQVDRVGRVDPASLASSLADHTDADEAGGVTLVSLQWANNETGVIQPIGELAAVCAAHRAEHLGCRVLFHSDASQAVGKLPVDVGAVGLDLMSFSAHKFHGPKGVGALFVRTGVGLCAQQRGGPQERDRRAGTENVPGVVGMGVAAELAGRFLAEPREAERVRAMRDRFEREVQRAIPSAVVIGVLDGREDCRLWNTSNIGFPRLESEAILLGLSERGVCASAGAACSSGSLEPSPVLLAMGVPEQVAHGAIRFSLGRFTTEQEIDDAVRIVAEVVGRLSKTLPMGV